MVRLGFLVAFVGSILDALGQDPATRFGFDKYFVAPIRVHLLSAKSSPAAETTLTETDIERIFVKLNRIWSQAGFHFYLDSLVREDAVNTEGLNSQVEPHRLLGLRPQNSATSNLFHVYYIKSMPNNGIYFPEGIFVKDSASLKPVPDGIDEPIPRVTSHELGHALSLEHRQNTTNLMASGTSGTSLNQEEIARAREAAGNISWIESASDVLKKANKLFQLKRMGEASVLYSALAGIPVKERQVDLAHKRLLAARRALAKN